MRIRQILDFLNNRFPVNLQESYDNSGNQIVFPDAECSGIMLALDVTPESVSQAVNSGCNCLLTHHPLFFRGIKSLVSDDPVDRMVIELISRKVTVFSMHTNLDNVLFNAPASVMGFPVDRPLTKSEENGGMGSISTLEKPLTLRELLARVTETLHLSWVTYTGELDMPLRRIAVLGGSGGRFIEKELVSLDVDCIITGDVGYHAWTLASMYSRTVIDAGHFGTERLFLNFLEGEITDFLTKSDEKDDIQIVIASEENPVHLYSRGT